jgi:hypothetical protein
VSEDVLSEIEHGRAPLEVHGVKMDVTGKIRGGKSAGFTRFRKKATKGRPSPRTFHKICLALSVLRDDFRR